MSNLTSYSAQKRECLLCGEKKWVSGTLKVCSDCIEQNFSEAKEVLAEAHKQIREQFSLPYPAPKAKGKETVTCNLCSNECSLAPNEKSFCGLRKNVRGTLQSKVTTQQGISIPIRTPYPQTAVPIGFALVEQVEATQNSLIHQTPNMGIITLPFSFTVVILIVSFVKTSIIND